MSNLLKSKFLMGVMIVAALFAVGVAVAPSSASAAACSIATTLRVGSTGPEVMCLQSLVGASQDGKFGPMTAAAVKAFQTSKSLAADGVVGPMTRAALMGSAPVGQLPAGCQPGWAFNPMTSDPCTPGTTPPPANNGDLEGGAGSITWDDKSTYSNEEVVAGDEDVKVLAFEIEADDESDVQISSVKVELAQTDGSNSQRIEDYMDSVSVWMGSDKVGESDASDFSENSDVYTRNISLEDAVVRAGEKETFVIALNALSNLDSGDIDDDAWTVDVISVRFEDGDGVVTTENTDSAPDLFQAFDFDDLASSGDLELKLTKGSENPDAQVVEVDDTSDTEVTMLEFKLKAEGSDMVIDNMEFDTLAFGVDSTFADMVSDLTLMAGTDELDSTSSAVVAQDNGVDDVMGTSDDVAGTVEFTDLDYTIDEGETITFTVVAKIKDVATGSGVATAFDQGDSFKVSFTGSNLDNETNTDVEDQNGDTVDQGDRTGSVAGEAQTFYSNGIAVEFVDDTATSVTVDGADNDRAELVIKFKVTAFGEDAYVVNAKTATSFGTDSSGTAPSTTQGVGYYIQYAGGVPDASTVTGTTLTSTADEETNSFIVHEGDSETFTLKVVVTNDALPDLSGDSVRAILTGIGFGNSDLATADSVYTSNLQSDYKTDYAIIAD